MELTNTLSNNLSNEIVTKNNQTSFLQTTLGKVINLGLDTGIRALLPDLIEDQVIIIVTIILI